MMSELESTASQTIASVGDALSGHGEAVLAKIEEGSETMMLTLGRRLMGRLVGRGHDSKQTQPAPKAAAATTHMEPRSVMTGSNNHGVIIMTGDGAHAKQRNR